MAYSLAKDGDRYERMALPFLQTDFPSYERFWLKHVVALTNRPVDVHFKTDAILTAEGRTHEDVAIAQLHYTVLKHLLIAHQQRWLPRTDETVLFFALTALCAAQDVAFELLQRYTNPGTYDPWLEKRAKGVQAGQDAQADWKLAQSHPLQEVRDYRNKLMHGRMLPVVRDGTSIKLPIAAAADRYSDWRLVTNATGPLPTADFEDPSRLLDGFWNQTVVYLETTWQTHLLP